MSPPQSPHEAEQILGAVESAIKINPALNEWQVLQDRLEHWFKGQMTVRTKQGGEWSDSLNSAVVQRAVTLGLRPSADHETPSLLVHRFLALTPDEREGLLTRVENELLNLNPPSVKGRWMRRHGARA